MRRRLIPTLAALSLAWSVALAGLGVVSWWQIASVGYVRPAGPWTARVQCMDGAAELLWWGSTNGVARAGFSALITERDAAGEGKSLGRRIRTAAAGFEVYRGKLGAGWVTAIVVPVWVLVLVTGLPPAWWVWRRKRRGPRGFPVEAIAA